MEKTLKQKILAFGTGLCLGMTMPIFYAALRDTTGLMTAEKIVHFRKGRTFLTIFGHDTDYNRTIDNIVVKYNLNGKPIFSTYVTYRPEDEEFKKLIEHLQD
jgi:hypothetical protein